MTDDTATTRASSSTAPTPLLKKGQAVDWWFAFKFDAKSFPGQPKSADEKEGLFGGTLEDYDDSDGDSNRFSQAYCFASSEDPTLAQGEGHIGTSLQDPVGATFGQVYDGDFNFLVWNDQFYGNPMRSEAAPHGHSKGLLAWNDAGAGFVMQVSTPSWPGSGSRKHPRQNDGNTLGYVNDDDIEVSQHFFALKLNADDVEKVLQALINARIVTNPELPELARWGGPQAIIDLRDKFGKRPKNPSCQLLELSSGTKLISKPGTIDVPVWQLVSAQLGSVDLRVATWWAHPKVYSTTKSTPVGCWDDLLGTPGAVEIATSGTWKKKSIGLKGGSGPGFNHAKFGVSTAGDKPLTIFGDMNQQGTLSAGSGEKAHKCSSSQNGRGGLFFVLEDEKLHASVSALLVGDSAREAIPADADG